MNEDEYQLGIRDLSKHDLVTLVNGYRNSLTGFLMLINSLKKSEALELNAIVNEIFKAKEEELAERIHNYKKVLEDYRG